LEKEVAQSNNSQRSTFAIIGPAAQVKESIRLEFKEETEYVLKLKRKKTMAINPDMGVDANCIFVAYDKEESFSSKPPAEPLKHFDEFNSKGNLISRMVISLLKGDSRVERICNIMKIECLSDAKDFLHKSAQIFIERIIDDIANYKQQHNIPQPMSSTELVDFMEEYLEAKDHKKLFMSNLESLKI